MNAISLAKTAYAAPGQSTRTLRGMEYDLFARTTRGLKAAQSMGAEGFATLANAIYENRRLWTTLAADVASPDNGLPAALRARLFYLAEFTNTHSRKVLTGEASAEVLIDINTSVMRGLRDEGAIK